jgi:alcohol dehydrogenase class IV
VTFQFATATQIIFGRGVVAQLPALVTSYGRRALVVTGANPARVQVQLDALAEAGVEITVFAVGGEPTTALAEQGAAAARHARADVVVAIGGGSALDTGKAIAMLATNGGTPLDYLEVIGAGKSIIERCAPLVAVPTTAGTGSEVTRNAVLASEQHRVKVSLRSPLMLPHVALVDPALTDGVPKTVTASTGLDALTQVLEPYVSHLSNPLTDGICREGMTRAARALRAAYDDGSNRAARDDMAVVSLFGGLALANAKLGAVHGLAGPLGGMFGAPHGALCARLLPFVMEANIAALAARAPDSPSRERYDDVARLLTGDATATAGQAVAWVRELVEELAIPPLAAYGITAQEIETILAKARASSSMKGNPIELSEDELRAVAEQAL